MNRTAMATLDETTVCEICHESLSEEALRGHAVMGGGARRARQPADNRECTEPASRGGTIGSSGATSGRRARAAAAKSMR